MTLPQGANYSLTESALIPFQAEPTHIFVPDAGHFGHSFWRINWGKERSFATQR